MENLLIIGSKDYLLNLSNILDRFKNNVRINTSIPNGRNGFVIDTLYLNNHVFDNLIKKRCSINTLKKIYSHIPSSTENIKKLKKITDEKKYNKVKQQFDIGRPVKSNLVLKNLGISQKLKLQGRCGLQCILEFLKNNHKNIVIYGFSVDEKNNKHITHKKDTRVSNYHSVSEEHKIIKELHRKKLIDATLCMLEYTEEPILDCTELEPSEKCLKLLLEEFKEIKIKGDKFDKNMIEKNSWKSEETEDLLIIME